MDIKNDPPLTELLRAARENDEHQLDIIFKKIIKNGIETDILNATDKNGRTAISYICVTELINYLAIMLKIPHIDINKQDNEGNSLLHYVAEAGQRDSLNMILTNCKNLKIDLKNNLGFTPLMKSSLQGHTNCAKLLLFAGASTIETDYGRKLNAIEWAKFCGRYKCAEMLEKCSKVRQMDNIKSLPIIQTKFIGNNVKTTNSNKLQRSESFSSKFKKYLPFKTNSEKDKSGMKKNKKSNTENIDFNVAFCESASCPASSSSSSSSSTMHSTKRNRHEIMLGYSLPYAVPKLEITSDSNQHLINKYQEKMKKRQAPRPPSPRMPIRN